MPATATVMAVPDGGTAGPWSCKVCGTLGGIQLLDVANYGVSDEAGASYSGSVWVLDLSDGGVTSISLDLQGMGIIGKSDGATGPGWRKYYSVQVAASDGGAVGLDLQAQAQPGACLLFYDPSLLAKY